MKWSCTICGYTCEGDQAPEQCPICKAPAEKFKAVEEGEMNWAAEHVLGVAKGVDEEILQGLRENFEGECSEVGMYLAMGRVACREGYPDPRDGRAFPDRNGKGILPGYHFCGDQRLYGI